MYEFKKGDRVWWFDCTGFPGKMKDFFLTNGIVTHIEEDLVWIDKVGINKNTVDLFPNKNRAIAELQIRMIDVEDSE
jgi:hypothetical protein